MWLALIALCDVKIGNIYGSNIGLFRYDEDGHTMGEKPDKATLPLVKRLQWEMPEEVRTSYRTNYVVSSTHDCVIGNFMLK